MDRTIRYKTLNDYQEETHQWDSFIPENADKLILGTFPTASRNRGAYEFFYPNPRNSFWITIFKVAGKNLSDYDGQDPVVCRKQILSTLNLGITDMGYRILRQRGSSGDNHIFPLEYRDIFLLLDSHPNITKIIITSSSGGNSVMSWFKHYCLLNGTKLKFSSDKKIPFNFNFSFKQKKIAVFVVPSCSQRSPYKGEQLLPPYRDAILG